MENTKSIQTLDEKDQRWIQLIEKWRESRQTIADFVRNQDDITYEQFQWHRKRLFPEDTRIKEEITWTSLSMEIPTSSFEVLIHDYRVVVKTGFDQQLLREVLEVLKHAN